LCGEKEHEAIRRRFEDRTSKGEIALPGKGGLWA